MARALSKLKRWDEAVVAYQHAIHIKNDWVLPFIDLAYAFERLEQWQEAIAYYQRAMELEPENPECRERLARLLLSLDRKEEAAEAYSQLIALSSSAELSIILGEILCHIARADLAIPAYCRAIELDPRISLGYNRLGSTLEQVERFDDALMIYEQAVASTFGDAETQHRLESLRQRSAS
jgi:tetratricopeptide (TPR) repeat protein